MTLVLGSESGAASLNEKVRTDYNSDEKLCVLYSYFSCIFPLPVSCFSYLLSLSFFLVLFALFISLYNLYFSS